MDISCRAHNEGYAALPAEYVQPQWYAVYTCANHEKRVAEQLERRMIEHFLPLYQTVRRWKDRRKRLHLPLFPGYLFIRLALRDQSQVVRLPGVVNLVGFSGMPKALAQEEVEDLRRALASGVRAEPYPYLPVGQRVRIVDGPLTGREGILKRWKGNLRVVLSVELIQRSILADVDVSFVVPV